MFRNKIKTVDAFNYGMRTKTLRKDYNRTNLNLEYDTELTPENKERIKSYVYDNNDEDVDNLLTANLYFWNSEEEKDKEIRNRKEEIRRSGLTSRNMDKKLTKSKTVFSEGKTLKCLNFKNVKFLSEEHMLGKIPEKYIVDGNVFAMKDRENTQYIVEVSKKTEGLQKPFVEFNVLSKINKEQIKEEMNRIKDLFYFESEAKTPKALINEEVKKDGYTSMKESLDKMRKLQNKII